MQTFIDLPKNCPVCNSILHCRQMIEHVDYCCKISDDHHYSFRVKEDGGMTKERIRFTEENGEVLRLKVYYDKGYTEVWSKANSVNRIRIDHLIVPDFTNIPKLKNKIKTFLVFG